MSDSIASTNDPNSGEPKSSNAKSGSCVFMALKIFALLIILMLGAIGVAYAIGGSQMEFVVTQDIKSNASDVYKLVTEPDSVEKWVTGITKIEPVGDIKGNLPGAKSEITVEQNGAVLLIKDEVISSRNGRHIELDMKSEVFKCSNRFEISYKNNDAFSDDTVVVTQTYKITFTGIARIFAPFTKGMIEEQLKSDLAKLKLLAEEANDEKPAKEQGEKDDEKQQ